MVANHGPDRLSEVRVLETPPGNAQLLSAHPSQGVCSISTIVTCDLGDLAAGSQSFVTIAVRATGEGDYISTAVASAKGDNGAARETSALATTRGVAHAPALTLRRPLDATTFWLNRNNTIKWTLRGVSGPVRIELSRDDGGTWTTLSDDAENVGFYDWTGTGGPTARARVRVSSAIRRDLTQTSPAFAIATR